MISFLLKKTRGGEKKTDLQEYQTEIETLSLTNDEILNLAGQHDCHLKMIEDELSVKIFLKDNKLVIRGSEDSVNKTASLLSELIEVAARKEAVSTFDIGYALRNLKSKQEARLASLTDAVLVNNKGKLIRPKTLNQKKYIEAIKENDMVFAVGPAGTGKTYLAVGMAVAALKNKLVSRIILTRPAVEAGEKLGFLPGDLQEKVDPYLRPLYDSLFDMMDAERFQKNKERGIIEVAPLAYMRGRSLNDAFIILDEAQNTTYEQMKMFLTRLGVNSKAVINGDITQIDLPEGKKSGLVMAWRILKDVSGIGFVFLSDDDVVRHDLVRKIINAYQHYEGSCKELKYNEK